MSSTTASSKPARKASSKKTETAVSAPVEAPAPTPVAAPVEVVSHVEAPVAASTAPASSVDDGASLIAEYNALLERVDVLRNAMTAVVADVKKLGRRVVRVARKADKRRGRKATTEAGGEAKPKKDGVFTRPNKISDELCVFLGKPKGTEMARSEVTRAVIAYCKSKNLMEGQNIKTTDPALRKLLRLNESSTLSILTLQTPLKQHYIKTVPAVASTTPATKA